jgi:hypothetical protein
MLSHRRYAAIQLVGWIVGISIAILGGFAFWATTGQAVVLTLATGLLVVITAIANRAAATLPRSLAGIAWVIVPAGVLFYLLVARDWRRELTSRSMLPNER